MLYIINLSEKGEKGLPSDLMSMSSNVLSNCTQAKVLPHKDSILLITWIKN